MRFDSVTNSNNKVNFDSGNELVIYKLNLVGVQEFRWDKGNTVRTGDYSQSQ